MTKDFLQKPFYIVKYMNTFFLFLSLYDYKFSIVLFGINETMSIEKINSFFLRNKPI